MKLGENIELIGKCAFVRIAHGDSVHERVLVIGDLHFGYEEVLNRGGVYVSRTMFKDMKNDLEKIFDSIKDKIDTIVLLGDVKHEFGSIVKQEWKELSDFFAFLRTRADRIMITRGNHDVILEPVASKYDIVLRDVLVIENYCFAHGDRDYEEMHGKNIKTWFLGHGHPAVVLSDGVKQEKYKCFLAGEYERKKIILVPSFFSPTEGSDPRQNDLQMAWDFDLGKFEVCVVSEQEILDFGKLKSLK